MKEKTQFIAELKNGQPLNDAFVLAAARAGQSRNGPFWSLTLQDRTGRLEAKMWSPASLAYAEMPVGQIIVVEGQVQTYKDQLQAVLEKIDEAAAEYPLNVFMEASSRPAQDMLEEIEAICQRELTCPLWIKFMRAVLQDPDIRARLLKAPGAKAMHHAYEGGLLEHTLAVLHLCLDFCDRYPELDREILVCAASLHDLGKAWELVGGLTNDYTDEGRLVGHIFLGLNVMEPFFQAVHMDEELLMHFRHIILSHHGEYEYGSPKRPKTAEALALHYADNLDAKLQQFRSAFAGEEHEYGLWSPYQRSLERYLYKPSPTPNVEGPHKRSRRQADKDEPQERQGSLLGR